MKNLCHSEAIHLFIKLLRNEIIKKYKLPFHEQSFSNLRLPDIRISQMNVFMIVLRKRHRKKHHH